MGDQWRRQSLGFMHCDPVITPRFDSFAREGNERPADKPFMLWLSMAPPHNTIGGPDLAKGNDRYQYNAPPEYENMYSGDDLPAWHPDTDLAPYRRQAPGHFGCITSMDHEFGRLLQCLKEEDLENDTIVLVTADHGEMLGIHGRWMKDIWFEESIGIPFIIRWPGHITASVNSELMRDTLGALYLCCG